MRITNHHNLSAPIVKALSRDDYTRGASHRSVTQLIDSPRIRILRERHWDELTEDISEKMWSVLGTAVHRIFEDHAGDDDRGLPADAVFSPFRSHALHPHLQFDRHH